MSRTAQYSSASMIVMTRSVTRVGGVKGEVSIEVIDLEQHLDAIDAEDGAVVLPVGIVILTEVVERGDRSQHARDLFGAAGLEPCRDHHAAAAATTPQRVAEGADAGRFQYVAHHRSTLAVQLAWPATANSVSNVTRLMRRTNAFREAKTFPRGSTSASPASAIWTER